MSVGTDTPARPVGRGLFALLDEKVNPVLLRDLRLYMRGKIMLAAYFLSLFALVMIAVLYTVIARFDGTDGKGLLTILTNILAVLCGAMIPNLVFERFRSELSNRATELALTSPLTAAQLVRGKLLGAWCMVLMVVSASAPMFATAYLLGGINLLSVAGIVGGVVLAGFTLPVLQLYLAADFKRGKGASRAVAALLFVMQLILMFGYSTLLNNSFVRSGYRSESSHFMLTCLAIAAVLIAQFLYHCAVSVIRGEAENRDVAPRISLTLSAVAGGLCAFFLFSSSSGMSMFGGADKLSIYMGVLCIVSYAFCVGFTAVTNTSPVIPRNFRERWKSRKLWTPLLMPGVGSLTLYFVLNALLLLVAPFGFALYKILGGVAGISTVWVLYSDRWWYFLDISMAPYMAMAYGIVVYYYLILPLVADKRNPKLLSHTITLTNVGLAFMAVFAMVLVSYVWGESDFYQFVLGATPVGLVTAAIEDSELTEGAGMIGLFISCVLTLLLMCIVWKQAALEKKLLAEDAGNAS